MDLHDWLRTFEMLAGAWALAPAESKTEVKIDDALEACRDAILEAYEP